MPLSKRPEKEALLSMYTEEGMTDREIARQMKVNRLTVLRWRKKYGIEVEFKQLFQIRVKRGGE